MEYSLVIATLDRPEALADALRTVAFQTKLPALTVIVDASSSRTAEPVAAEWGNRIPILYLSEKRRSAALQRNRGIAEVKTELVGFIDDDVTLEPDVFEKLAEVFEANASQNAGGVAARMVGAGAPRPKKLLRFYYQLQAGYADDSYGAKLFGPGINCFPCYDLQTATLIKADWLNTGCVLFLTELVRRIQFPGFQGYSHMEDVYLSAMIGKEKSLYFHRDAIYEHHDAPNRFKRAKFALARGRLKNQRIVAQDVLGLRGLKLFAKLLLHRIFVSVYILRRREKQWFSELAGTWF